jgi:DedD protein
VRLLSGRGASHAAARAALSSQVYNQIVEASVKERLTGAVIFVAAVIVIVPEMFSGPEPKSTAVASAQPAEAGPPLRTFSMTLNDSGESRAAPVAIAPPVQPVEPPTASQPAAAQPPPVAAEPVIAAKTDLPAPDAGVPAGEDSWWLRVGIFGVRDNAERLAKRLRADGIAVELDKQVIGGKDMYRVRAGPVRDRAAALALQARLKASGDDSLLLPPSQRL